MKNMRKVLSIFVSLMIIFTLTACSKVDKNYGVKSKEENTRENGTTNFDQDMKIMSSDRIMSKFIDISLYDEENYSEIYLGKKFKIHAHFTDDEFQVPTKLSDLESMGWIFAEGNEYDAESLIFAYETVNAVFVNENGTKIRAQFYNSSRSSVKISKCYIVKFRIENDFYADSNNYNAFNINGITNTMAVTDVIDTLGAPSHFYAVSDDNYYLDYFISKKDRRNGITVHINPVDDNVTAIEFSYYK